MTKLFTVWFLLFFGFLYAINIYSQTCTCNAGMARYKALGSVNEPTVGVLEGGYASKLNVYQGETISFHVSTFSKTFTLKIYRYGKTKELVKEINDLPGGIKTINEDDAVWENGCNWPAALENFRIPQDWRAGAYIAEFPYYSDQVTPILFFVKEKDPAKRSRLLVACATNTYQAYNMFGGKSVYDDYGLNPPRAGKLSFNRPLNKNDENGVNRGSFDSYEAKLIYWLESFGYGKDVDVIGESDLDFDPLYLNSHDVLLMGGHSEYWSRGMRENVEAFINKGGHFMCLSGNTCWWQVRFENGDRTLVCKKREDDVNDRKLETTEWYKVERENPLLGTSYQYAGQVNYHWFVNKKPLFPGCLPYTKGYGSYIVHNSQHWVYKNSGLADGDTLGTQGDSSIVGYETDCAIFAWQNGIPVPTGEDMTPSNFRILGLSPSNTLSKDSPDQWATMGVFKYPGTGTGFVFNTATIRWVWGLNSNNSKVSIITKNVLDHFLANHFPPEITAWSPYIVKSDSVLGKQMFFNSRICKVKLGKNITFKIEAKNYAVDDKVMFAWAINDTIIEKAKSSFFTFQNWGHEPESNKVKAFVYNQNDTVFIEWQVRTVENMLSIVSIPDTLMRIGKPYCYKFDHFSKYNDQVKYTINHMPKWASFESKNNTIQGIPNCTKDSISVTVEDLHGNKDLQEFTLKDNETVLVKNTSKTTSDYFLAQNYPNPFNPATYISYTLPDSRDIKLIVYDVLGNKVNTLVKEVQAKGKHTVRFDASNLPSGIYYYRLEADDFFDTKKLILVK